MSDSLESTRRTAIAPFFVTSGVMEIGAGVALLATPHLAIRLVFGSSGTEAGVALGRLAGVALLSLGTACLLARHDGVSQASTALVSGMSAYNAAVVGLILTGGLGSIGLLLSGVAVLHAGMAGWGLLLLLSARAQSVSPTPAGRMLDGKRRE